MADTPPVDLAEDLMDLARCVESEAKIAARPGQLDRLDAIANRLRALSGLIETAEILADPGMVQAIREGDAAVAAGDVVSSEEVAAIVAARRAALSSEGAATDHHPDPDVRAEADLADLIHGALTVDCGEVDGQPDCFAAARAVLRAGFRREAHEPPCDCGCPGRSG